METEKDQKEKKKKMHGLSIDQELVQAQLNAGFYDMSDYVRSIIAMVIKLEVNIKGLQNEIKENNDNIEKLYKFVEAEGLTGKFEEQLKAEIKPILEADGEGE